MLGAADTFRAAGVEQLELWAQRAGVGFVKGARKPIRARWPTTRSPGPARGADVVIIDTAGRLHTQDDLMAESEGPPGDRQADPEAPHETLLTVDATTGQNGLRQARLFSERSDQRPDPDQARRHGKGGIALAIAHEPASRSS